MLSTMQNKLPSVPWLKIILTIVFVALLGFTAYTIYKDYVAAPETPVKVDTPNINLSLHGNEAKESQPTAVKTEQVHTVTREIQYVPKVIDASTGQKEKTDVQIDSGDKKVYVKVNGKEHELTPTIEESQKFENGKLVVEEKQKSEVEIKGPEPSKWTTTYLHGQGGKQGFGVGYAVNHVVRADLMSIDGDPYIGVTLSLGDLSTR